MAQTPSIFRDNARLPPSHAEANKSLRRLSRESLIEIALEWLQPENQTSCAPVPDLENNATATATGSLDAIRHRFESATTLKDSRKEVLEAIGIHWSRGLSLRQWALVDDARLRAEMGEGSSTAGSMQWRALLAEAVAVDGDSDPALAAALAMQGDERERAARLRFESDSIAGKLQDDLGPLLRTHVHVVRPAEGMAVLRVVCFADESVVGSDGRLLNVDGIKVVYLAFPDVGGMVYVSPATVKLDGDDAQSLVVQSFERILSSARVRIRLVDKDDGGRTLTCRALFSDVPLFSSEYEHKPTGNVHKGSSKPGAGGKAPKTKEKPDLQKRKRIAELRKTIRFQDKEEEDEEEEEDSDSPSDNEAS